MKQQRQSIRQRPPPEEEQESSSPFFASLIAFACCIPIHSQPSSFQIWSDTNDAVVEEGPGFCALQKSLRADQDRFRVVERFGGDRESIFAGVFDGHGHFKDAVEFVQRSLHKNVLSDSAWPTDPSKALAAGFVRTDADFKNKSAERYFQCGTCAIAATISEGVLTVASAGDCQAVLIRGGESHNLVRPHRVETERERIERAGGIIVGNDTKRVNGVLMVTRAIGDGELKDAGVTALPETYRCRLGPADEYLVLGSDGLWDLVKKEEAASICLAARSPRKAAATLLNLALDRKTNDDTTVVVVDIQHYLAGARPRSSTAPPGGQRASIYSTAPVPARASVYGSGPVPPAPPSARTGTPTGRSSLAPGGGPLSPPFTSGRASVGATRTSSRVFV